MARNDFEVAVVGAGPAGLAAALYAQAAGLRTALIDPHPGVIDKACGEGLMPGAVARLAALGVAPSPAQPFVGIRYRLAGAAERYADGDFPGAPGLGVQRTVLSGALADRVAATAVTRLVGRVTAVQQDADGVRLTGPGLGSGRDTGPGAGLRCGYLLAADGLHSPLRRLLDLDAPPPRRPGRFGLRQHFAAAPDSPRVEVWWAEDCEAYVTPVAPDRVGVAFLFRRPQSVAGLWRRFPHLADRIAGAAATDRVRGAGPFEQRCRARVRGRALLVGDAAGYLDPLTGEGVALGLATAEAAVACVRAGDPAAYARAWRRATWRYFLLTDALLRLTTPPAVRPAMVGLLRRLPGLFDRAVATLAATPPTGGQPPPTISLFSTP